MDGLPFLPGNTFSDPTRGKYHRSQTLGYKNGYALQNKPEVGIGGVPIYQNQISEQDLEELANYNPTLTYGQAKQAPPADFVPAHVAWDKKVLKFMAWFKQTVHESPNEHFRVRHVNIYYYLEDDSISVVEPHVENAGMPQGKLIKRQRLPKNDFGDHWTWKDLNVGMNVTFYGKIFHIYDCDKWSREFLESEGIEVNPPEGNPDDPYITKRTTSATPKLMKTPSDFDKKRQFLEMDRKVLRFYAVWDDRDSMFGEMRRCVIHYYLVDDTMEVREIHSANDGHDPFPVLIGRNKIPKDRHSAPASFPRVALELTEQELSDYFTPRDFAVGKTMSIYDRRFLIVDCDNFTKAFYYQNFGITSFEPVQETADGKPIPKMEIAPYSGYGTLEDSMQSCLTLVPQPPKKDYIKMLENDGKVLRFEAVMDSPKPEDQGRKFIISYRLSDDMIVINEPPVRNSGRISGKFLERTRVAKPSSTPDKPQYYGPQDFYIGARLDIFKHKFVITNADHFVLKYMEMFPEQFPGSVVETLRQKLVDIPAPRGSSAGGKTYAPEQLRSMVNEVKIQIKKLNITSSNRKDLMFLGVDQDRQGYITRENIQKLFEKQHLPADPQVIEALAREIGPNPDRITFQEFRNFFENA